MNRTITFVSKDDLTTAQAKSAQVFQTLGTIKQITPHFIEGRIAYGLQSVKVHISWMSDEANTHIVVQSTSDDIWGKGAQSAAERFRDSYLNYNNPGFVPDKIGINSAALVGIVIGFILLLILLHNLIFGMR